MISLYELLDLLERAAEAGERGDDEGFAASAAAFVDGLGSTAGAVGGYEVDYLLRDLAAAFELDEPPAAGAARIRGVLERLRDAGL